MLALKRKVGESIEVDGPARICIVRSRGGTVTLGIQAERSVKVLRSELIPPREAPGQSVDGCDDVAECA
jgi:carbon storage regulator CsrA